MIVTPQQVAALRQAVRRFPTKAEFIRRMFKASEGRAILGSNQIRKWEDGKPVTPCDCPDIELLTGVPCEALRPDVNWWMVRCVAPTHAPVSPKAALQLAVAKYPRQADFLRALSASSGRNVTSAHLRVWLIRGTPIQTEFCPDIEHLTGIPCEMLRPDVRWASIRKPIPGCENNSSQHNSPGRNKHAEGENNTANECNAVTS